MRIVENIVIIKFTKYFSMITKHKVYNLPKGYSLLGGLLKAKELSKDLLKFISDSMEKFGGTYTASIGLKQKAILTQDPNFINYILREHHKNYQRSELITKRATQFYGEGFLFLDGAPWRRQRRLLQPSFHKRKINSLFSNILKTAGQFVDTFPTGENIDIYPLVYQLSFDILMKSLFSMEISAQTQADLKEIYSHLERFTYKDAQNPFSKILYPITGEEKRAFAEAKRLRNIFLTIIRERKMSKEDHSDLLDMLINSQYEDTGEKMSEEKIVDELIVMIQAGHDTTATTLAWIIYLVAKHPIIKEKLTNSIANYEPKDSLQNEYLLAVIHEAMRIYPTSWLVERTAIADDQFEDYTYPKGTMIIGFYYGLHRDKNLWKNAMTFHPERFIDDPKLSKSKQFYPFGGGQRMCIGNHFAMAEMALSISLLFQKFDLTSTGQVPKIIPMATLRPDKVMVRSSRRSK